MRSALLPLALGAALALGACGDGGSVEEAPAAATAAADAPAPAVSDAGAGAPATPARTRGPLVRLRDSQLGPVLFSGSNRALYLFTREDGGTRPRCYGDCAVAWPPFIARGRPRAGSGVRATLLGTTRRRDGRRQVTYAGSPLYFYVNDPRGRVFCNDIAEFGGTWFALTARGTPPA